VNGTSGRSGIVTADAGRLTGAGWHGVAAASVACDDPVGEVGRLIDPSAATETVHWGRNYLYAAELRTRGGAMPVVVKQFSNQSLRRQVERRLRGSKAERSWRAARALVAAGVATPEPLVLVESDRPDGPSFFITRRLEEVHEVRQFFRRISRESDAGEFPEVDEHTFLSRLGRFCGSIHEAGIWYRDLSMGNVLARPRFEGDLELFLVDCNRARVGRRLGPVRRIRDICRFPIIDRSHREAFLAGYWGAVPSRLDFRWWFWVVCVRGYLLKHAVKRRVKGLRLRRRHARHGAHPHIPEAASGADTRDKVVWDHLSDQPHQHASGGEKLAIRLGDSPDHLRDMALVLAAAPAVWRRYRALRSTLYAEPVPFDGVGLCVRPWPDDPGAHLAAIDELGVRRLLLRLHPWEDGHDDEQRLAAELHGSGYELAFALPQNRDLVRDRARWRSAIEELAERFAPFGRHFQVGQAPNRSKWGVWTRREYVELYQDAAEILRRRKGVELLGPAVIDFEYMVTLALANRRTSGLRFDVVSALLYVDRRGAPENRQLGLDTVDKVVLLRAIAETGRNTGPRCWITEVNWPLWEGPHSPAGKAASVDERSQADYLARYYLLTLGTGLVERVYWWRLAARGYGLLSPDQAGALRRRPSFHALRTLTAVLEGATFLGPLPAPAGRFLYRFHRNGVDTAVAWSVEPGAAADLPRPATRALDRDGGELPTPEGTRITLGPSPVYYTLEG
jgi:tRNA A-37 threonylcarbamoyl transferase component Bud32